MQKTFILLLALCGQTYTMDVDKIKQTSKVIIATWVVTPETTLNEHSEFRLFQYPNGARRITYTCRPKGIFEQSCNNKSVMEIALSSNSGVCPILLKHTTDNIELALPEEEVWYKHPVATHGAAVLSTILLIAALFH